MKKRVLLALLVAGCWCAAFAGTESVQPATQDAGTAKVDQQLKPWSPDAEIMLAALKIDAVGNFKAPRIDPNPPQVQDNCTFGNKACSCGLPVVDFNDPACTPGLNTGLSRCRDLHCQGDDVVWFRTCPCEGCGDHWTAISCNNP